VHRFLQTKHADLTENDVIAIPSLGALLVIFECGFSKGNSVYLQRFNRYATFLFDWDFLTGGGNTLAEFGRNDTLNVKL